MYGLLLVNMQQYVEKVFGAKKWIEVKEGMKIKVIFIHQISDIWNYIKCFVFMLDLRNASFLHFSYFRKTSLMPMEPFQKASL